VTHTFNLGRKDRAVAIAIRERGPRGRPRGRKDMAKGKAKGKSKMKIKR